MYIHTHRDIKCSACGAMNNSETVTRPIMNGSVTIRRCRTCGHESIISTLTTNATSISDPSIYTARPQSEPDTF